MLSPKRRLIISRVCEIMTVHRLYCEAKLPYLDIYRMIILPLDLVLGFGCEYHQRIQWHLENLSWRRTSAFGGWPASLSTSSSNPVHAASVRQSLWWWYGMLLTDQHRSNRPLRFESIQLPRIAKPNTPAKRVWETLFFGRANSMSCRNSSARSNINCRRNRNFL